MTRAELLAYIDSNVYPNANNEITALMVRDVLHRMVGFMGDAATYGVGDVAPSDPGLVTGGAVQGAINTALSSAIKFQGVTTTPLTDGSTDPDIVIAGDPYTARRGDEVIYGGREFLWTGSVWQQLGDEQSWALKTITISAGSGLTGGGDLTQNRTISLSQDSLNKLALAASAYQVPQGGIPKTDLASAVQTSLGNADTIAGYFTNSKLDAAHLPDLYLARTQVSGTAANKTLYGVDGISHAAAADNTDKSRVVWDADNDAWHFYGNIYTDGWFSGGGISQGGGGGGGGIDPVAMWRLLTNDPSLTQYDNYTKISADHIVFPVTSVVGLTGAITAQQIAQGLNLGSYAYKNSLTASDIPDLSGTYVHDLFHQLGSNSNVIVGQGTVANTSDGTSIFPTAYGVALQWARNYWYSPASGEDHDQWYTQIYSGTDVDQLYFRNSTNGSAWSSWRRIITETCWASYIGTSSAPVGYATRDSAGNQISTYYQPKVSALGSSTNPVYISASGSFSACTYSLSSTVNSGTANTIAYYSGANAVSSYTSTLGAENQPVYLNAGVPTAGKACLKLEGGQMTGVLKLLSETGSWNVGRAESSIRYFYCHHTQSMGAPGTYMSGASFMTGYNGFQFAVSGNTSEELFFRKTSDSLGWQGWRQIWHTGNFDPNNYLSTSNVYVMRGDRRSGYLYMASVGYYENFVQYWVNRSSGYGGFIDAYGISMNIVDAQQTWINRLDFGTNGEIDFWQGINTTTMTRRGKLWHSGNCNNTSTPWQASTLYALTGIYTDGWFSGGGLASSSDRRLKKNIKNFAYTPKLLLAIRPREWDWKDGSAMVGHAAGFVAQEIEPVMPYAVDGTRNFKALFYDRFHALEISALQDHERRIVDLERAVKERDEKIEKLEKRLRLN